MARPRINIDKKQFEKLCGIQCTKEEIASFFNCSEDTIENWCNREFGASFSVVFRQKRGLGKISLRRAQFRMAETNATMSIWLGKQFLGQRDNADINVSLADASEDVKLLDEYFKNREHEGNP